MTIIGLWATPRTVSTAFERMMIERGDHLVLDEPWSRAYYLGPDRRSARFPLCFPESSYAAVTSSVLGLGASTAVFVKDMAYQASPGLADDHLAAMTHTFLIRDPRRALVSLAKEWPDFTEDEAGYQAQGELFDRVHAITGVTPAVLDSDALRADPAGVIGAWCDRIGIDPRPDALAWTPGMRPEWPLWTDWYQTVAASTGFHPPEETSASGVTERAPGPDGVDAGVLERAIAVYERLRRRAIDA